MLKLNIKYTYRTTETNAFIPDRATINEVHVKQMLSFKVEAKIKVGELKQMFLYKDGEEQMKQMLSPQDVDKYNLTY